MILKVIRRWFDDEATEGELWIDGARMGFTLERAKTGDHPAIPEGLYEVIVNFSPHFQRLMPLLLNVPGREGIRIHPANAPAELKGCIAVGLKREKDAILESRALFEPLFKQIVEATEHDHCYVQIVEEPCVPDADGEISV